MGHMEKRKFMSSGNTLIRTHEEQRILLENPTLGAVLRQFRNAINQTAQNAGVSPVGQADAPPQIGALTVKASGETVHATINEPNQINNQIEYFLEYANEPNFLAPHVAHLKSARGHFLTLPAKNDAGDAQPWYFRAYSQYPGSKPSAPVYFGGKTPQKVTLSGTTQLTPLTSTGSGTATSTGGQGGWGRGKTPFKQQNQAKA